MSKTYIERRLGIHQLPTLISPAPAPTPTASSRASHPDKTLLTAWLLLLLDDGESYGRALFGELRERGIGVEPSLAYRDLRALDDEGSVTSRWTRSHSGPQRRSYRIARKGRRRLAELAAAIEATWRVHDSFVKAYERLGAQADAASDESARAGDSEEPAAEDHSAHPAGGPIAEREAPPPSLSRELVAAWLLLLLNRSASYGYELRRALDDHDVHPDPATVYRVLRKLDRAQWLESRWMNPAAGPRRRLYRVTGKGRRNLDELGVLITAIRDSHAAFLQAYGERSRGAAEGHRHKPAKDG